MRTRKTSFGPRVRDLLSAGLSNGEICRELGVSAATVCHHARSMGIPKAVIAAHDFEEIQKDIDSGFTVVKLFEKHGLPPSTYGKAVASGRLRPRLRPCDMDLEQILDFCANRRTTPFERRLIRRNLIKSGVPDECAISGTSQWLGKRICLEVDHINGDPTCNEMGNLRLLCPNCHSTTETWRGRNQKSRKIS